LTKSDSALNTIIRRLKCSNASKLFSKKPSDQKLSRSDSSKFPFLSRNLERSVNNWPSFEHKCREYAVQKEKTKEEESNKVEEESNHVEPIGLPPLFSLSIFCLVEFPPDDADDHQNNENVPGGETKVLVVRIFSGIYLYKSGFLYKLILFEFNFHLSSEWKI
jgi:hypothetical protein